MDCVAPHEEPVDSVHTSAPATRQKSARPSPLASTHARPVRSLAPTVAANPALNAVPAYDEQIARSVASRQKSALPSPVASTSAASATSPHSDS